MKRLQDGFKMAAHCRFGVILGPSRGILGPIWGDLGSSWDHLGPSWAVLGSILGFKNVSFPIGFCTFSYLARCSHDLTSIFISRSLTMLQDGSKMAETGYQMAPKWPQDVSSDRGMKDII